jgi:hypothetical protein
VFVVAVGEGVVGDTTMDEDEQVADDRTYSLRRSGALVVGLDWWRLRQGDQLVVGVVFVILVLFLSFVGFDKVTESPLFGECVGCWLEGGLADPILLLSFGIFCYFGLFQLRAIVV